MKKLYLTIISLSCLFYLNGLSQNWQTFDTSFHSNLLDETKSMRIYVPPGYFDDTVSYPIIYFLHGAGNNYTNISSHTMDIINMVDTGYINPMILVGFDGSCSPYSGSMYTNSVLYGNYEDYIIQECIPFAESFLRTKNTPDFRCIMGVSMGGYGSLKLALKNPLMFAGLASYAGFPQLDTLFPLWQQPLLNEYTGGPPYNYSYSSGGLYSRLTFTGSGAFSPNLDLLPPIEFPYDTMGNIVDSVTDKWEAHDISIIVRDLDPSPYQHPGIFFTAGTNDILFAHPSNVCFADTLDMLGIDYEFLSTDDGHTLSTEMLIAGMHFLDSCMFDSIWVGNPFIQSSKKSSLTVFPNPVRSTLNILTENDNCQDTQMITVYDLLGQVIINKTVFCKNGTINIDVSWLMPGSYLIKVSSQNYEQTQKFIKY